MRRRITRMAHHMWSNWKKKSDELSKTRQRLLMLWKKETKSFSKKKKRKSVLRRKSEL